VQAAHAAGPTAFLAWVAEHPRWRFQLAEAVTEVCAKPPELAAHTLALILEELDEA
jgi:hypothetical protein